MDLQRILKVLIVLLIGAGLALTACGEDPADNQVENQNQTNQNHANHTHNQTNQTETNQTNQTEINQTENQTNQNQTNQNQNEPDVILADPPPSCDDADRPERCDADAETFEWAPASVITELEIADGSCCFDLTGDNNINNALPNIPGLDRHDINQSIAQGIADGSFTLILEHEPLDGELEIVAGQEFNIAFLLGEEAEAPEEGFYIDPVSFEEGVHPQALLPNALIEDDNGVLIVTAGPGTVIISIAIAGIELQVAIRNAMIEAEISASSVNGGVVLENGILGGIILYEDLVDAVNRFGATCDCLDNPVMMIDPSEPVASDQCILDVPTEQIETCTGEESICGTIANLCGAIPLAPALAADLDTTGDGNKNAFSAGITFEAEGAVILGLMGEEEEGENGE